MKLVEDQDLNEMLLKRCAEDIRALIRHKEPKENHLSCKKSGLHLLKIGLEHECFEEAAY